MFRHYFILVALLVTACQGTDFNKPYSDTPTSGKVKIAADESLSPLADAQVDTFHGLYQYSEITLSKKSEQEIFQLLLDDSVKAILSSRKLSDQENAYFKSKNLIPQTTRIAVDAIALIINESNKDSLMSLGKLKALLSGECWSWKQINPASPYDSIRVVFDHVGSSTLRHLRDSLMNGRTELPSYCFAVKSNPQVLDYVRQNPSAIGVIGVNWISDKDDPKMLSFVDGIKVVWLSKKEEAVYPDDYFGPYQAYLYTGDYPLSREVFMINREGRPGLGTGFVSFVAGEQGQRIVRLAGLLPASPYSRDIRLN